MQNNVAFIKHVLETRGYIRIPSNGTSMAPLIKSGDICHFEPLKDIGKLKKGDILLYESHSGELIGHRLVGMITHDGERLFVCKGDFNRNPDPPIAAGQVVARLKMDGRQKIWGNLLRTLPILTVWIRYVIKMKSKLR